MTTTKTKVIGDPGQRSRAIMIGGGVAVALLAYGVLQLGTWLETGEWLRGGPNPGGVVGAIMRDGVAVNSWHVALAVLAAVLLAAGGLLAAHLMAKRASRPEIDKIAQYLGDGGNNTEEKVTADAIAKGLTTGDVRGLPIARVIRTGKWLWAGFRDGLIAIMGPGSGKTSALVIPLALEAPGAVWVTSNRADVAAALYSSRNDKGHCWIFDPQRVADVEPTWFWDPLSYVRADRTQLDVRATKLATLLADAARKPDAKTDAYFDPQGIVLVSNFLLAAALDDLPITTLLTWVASPKSTEPLDILRRHEQHTAADQVEGVQGLAHETCSSIYGAASNHIAFLKNQRGSAWVCRTDEERPEFDPKAYVRSSDTFVCLSREGTGSFGPLVAALTNAVIEAAEDHAKRQPKGRLPIPFFMPLDEVANVCKLQELPDLVSHAGGRGIVIMAILQSPGQAKAVWGQHGWDKLWGASVIRLVGRGVSDTDFQEANSKVAGDQDVTRINRSTSRSRTGGSRSTSDNWTQQRILPVSALTNMEEWRAVAMAAGDTPTVLELVPHFRRPEMAEKVRASEAAFAARHHLAVDA